MTAITDSYVLGLSPTPDNNFLLDTDGTGALRVRRRADGSGGLLLNIAADGKITLPSQPASAYSCVRLDTQNGNGSSATCIPRFLTSRLNQGTDVVYADSVVNGASFTTATAGDYAISFTHSAGGSEGFGITLNETPATWSTNMISVARAEILQMSDTPSAGVSASVTWTGYLAAGSVIRPHTGGGTSSSSRFMFTMTKVSQ